MSVSNIESNKHKLTELEKARRQKVAKRNDMMRSRQSLSLVENKVVTYVFSKVKPEDDPDTIYRFDCQEFFKIMRYKKQSYSDLRAMLYSIASQTFGLIDDETGTEKIVHWFDTIHLKKDKSGKLVSESTLPGRYVEIRIHRDLREYVFGLEQQRKEKNIFYSTYQLQNVSLFEHVYSQHLYELLKTYENAKQWKFEYGTGTENDIQMKLAVYQQVDEDENVEKSTGGRIRRKKQGVPKYRPIIPARWSKFYYFEKDVLKPGKAEINKYTDIEFEYFPSKYDMSGKKRRRYSTITFIIRKKTKAQKLATDEIIDKEYEAFDDQYAFRQLSMDDFLKEVEVPEAYSVPDEEELIRKEKAKEAAIDKAEYKVAASVFYNDFKQKEIKNLVEAALRHCSPLRVRRGDREMWAIDFISHYYDKIKATEDDTRTTTYKRLLDAVTKDYDNMADETTIYDVCDNSISDDTYTEVYNDISDGMNTTGNEEGNNTDTVTSSPATEKKIEDMSLDELDREIERLKKLLDIAELKRQAENEQV